MKIVYCIAATSNSGGMERVLANKANYFIKQGYEVHIVTTDQKRRTSFFPLDERVQQHDLQLNYVDDVHRPLLSKILLYKRKQQKHKVLLNRLLHEIQPDIVLSMFDHEVSFLWGIQDGSKKLLEIHFSRFKRLQYGRKGIWKFIDRWRSHQDKIWAAKYDRFIVLTEEDKFYWGEMSNILVIPNANSFEPEVVSTLENKQVIAVGRYDYQKGFDELIHIWSSVISEYPDWSLHIFGHGPLQKTLTQLIEQLGLSECVFLEKPVADIRKAYLKSSILAMTSRYEGLPMALLEAQVCGLPMVTYACKCGPRDIVKNSINGFLIEEGDQAAFAEGLQKLMENQSLRKSMGKQAKHLSANFSEEKVMQKWLDLFTAVNE